MAEVAAVVNWLNLTTLAGLAVAKVSGCDISRRGPYFQAVGYRHKYPLAGAFTVGGVVISRRVIDDRVWGHEVGHIRQYAWCGPMFLPLYGLAAGWSWLRVGDWWSRNIFERRAGLAAGGYVERTRVAGAPRSGWRRRVA